MASPGSWTQKHGSFALSVLMAAITGLFWFFDSRQKGEDAKKTAEAAQALAQRIDKEGGAYDRETRNMVFNQGEKIARIESNQDRALELLGNQREVTARMAEQINYLVRICGEKPHASNDPAQKIHPVAANR